MLTDFNSLSENSRTWVYQANRKLTASDKEKCLSQLDAFLNQWAAHGNDLMASGIIKYDYFLIISTDESFNMASGCSIDTQVRFMQQLSSELGIDFFQRTNIAFLINNEVELVSLGQIKIEVEKGRISSQTLFFDNTIQTKSQLDNNWCVEAGKTWLNRYFKQAASV
ncbi:hypothetical protein [Roseivirga echinicomitans]|uniref:ABC transporter ATPase n=1 Tax=Roseivirga echinicomitans TaxID=296218 RepID=A0A150XYU0_9BACT|nr:hypothetical protein [Roseivirga echinicomitans]KYG83871.1 hypothetical protein AWN68_03460 [Roseivirga echinicomitans]